MRDTNKGFMAVKVKQDTYIFLKALAANNNCTLAALIHDAVSKLAPDDSGNIFNKISRIEAHLKQLDDDFTRLYSLLSTINISEDKKVFQPIGPLRMRAHLYQTDADLARESIEMADRLKAAEEDEKERDAAIARGEDVVERQIRKVGSG